MNFCCGKDMLLTIAQLHLGHTVMTNVPVLFCLACEQITIHPDVELEFELLKDFARGDRAGEVDLKPYVKKQELYDLRNHVEFLRMNEVVKHHIDHALELYSLAQSAEDPEWKEDILKRLVALNNKNKSKIES
ncbi:hypothetical protein [Ammoniphilus sp. YIM 78166]|uniref:hypothetical protein n=1 Tax=Ammoniphilus sp. YIM 78166 TaxID=1644106 RepID=UPI00106F49C8|nr:hypothetical protein [Ammoniphilus sp. YIM 78166]